MTDKDTHKDISSIRQDYALQSLTEKDALKDAIHQFQKWFDEALSSEVREPNAMALGTVSEDNSPSVRIVLLKGIEFGSFRFFTNYNSQKGTHILNNPKVSLMFFWPELERQVRIDGTATKLPADISEAYFHSRPIGSQIGAVVSPQSQVIASRLALEEKENALKKEMDGRIISKPAHWGGYQVQPKTIEFWQGRPSRLHDRLRYTAIDGSWKIQRLAP